MNGSYNTVKEQLKDTYKRERKPIKVVSTDAEYDVIFRRSGNRNTTKNYGTIFYFKDKKDIKQGKLLLFRNKYFIVLNQEEIENDVYYRSDLVQTNCVLESLFNKIFIDGKWYANEIAINSFADDIKSNATINGSVITTLGGRLELMAEDNVYTRMIAVDDVFTEFGGNFKVTGIYWNEGLARLTLERTTTPSPSYTPSLIPNHNDYYAEYEYNLYDFVSPIITEMSGTASSDYIIKNATFDVISSDESIAEYNNDTGLIKTYAEGNVNFTFTWVERDITVEETFEIKPYVAPQAYAKITYSGLPEVRQSGSTKAFTAKVFDAYDNEITDYTDISFNWANTIPTAQLSDYTINTATKGKCTIQAGDKAVIGTVFDLTLNVTDTTNTTYVSDTVQIKVIPIW